MEYFLIFAVGAAAGYGGKSLVDRAIARWKRIDFDTSTEG